MMVSKTSEKSIHSLSIQIYLDGLSFCIQNYDNGEVITQDRINFTESYPELTIGSSSLQHLDTYIKDVFKDITVLQEDFKNVTVIYDNELFTTVPSALFDVKKAADYLKFNTKILSTDVVAHDQLDSNDIVNVYIPYTNVNNYFFDRFGSFEFYHSSTIFLGRILNSVTTTTETEVAVCVNNAAFYLIVTKRKKLELINRFNFKTKEDFIYYILFTYEQLELDPETVTLHLSGDIKEGSNLYQIAYEYIRTVTISSDPYLLTTNPHLPASTR